MISHKTRLRLIRLFFKTPLHIHGTRADYAESLRRVHSDTLHAALIQSWAMMGRTQWLDALEKREGMPDFALSSLFPFTTTKNGAQIHFLPRPKKAFSAVATKKEFAEQMKKLKKLEWLDVHYFAQQVENQEGASPLEKDIQDDIFLTKVPFEFAAEKDERKALNHKFMWSSTPPHANIPRDLNAAKTNPYVFERLHFRPKSGFYFLFEGSDDAFAMILDALHLLQDEGIGSDRHLGNGQFEYEVAADSDLTYFQKLFESESNYRTNLSLFIPESEAQLQQMLPKTDPYTGYELVKRGGWVTTEPYLSLHKNAVFMFAEGSVFHYNQQTAGKTINIAPKKDSENDYWMKHPVWRVGHSLFVPIQFNT